MGWKENKQKHKEFVDKVADLLTGISTGDYILLKDKDVPVYYVENILLMKYGWKRDKDYQMKQISKRKNKYHFRVVPYDIIENIDIKIVIEE